MVEERHTAWRTEWLAPRFVQRTFGACDVIVIQGKGGAGFLIVVSGDTEAVLRRGDGSATTCSPLGPGDFSGEKALPTDARRSASVVARTPIKCIALTR